MEIKITLRYHFPPSGVAIISKAKQNERRRTSFGEGVEKLGFPYTVVGNAERYPPPWKSVDLAMPLLDMHPRELKTNLETERFTGMFTAALFTTAKRRELPKRPSTEEKKHSMSSGHTIEYYLARKRNEVPIRGNPQTHHSESIMPSESTQTQKATYLLHDSISRKSPQRQTSVDREQVSSCLGSTGGGGEGALAGKEGQRPPAGTGTSFSVVVPALWNQRAVAALQHRQCTSGAPGSDTVVAFSERAHLVDSELTFKDRGP